MFITRVICEIVCYFIGHNKIWDKESHKFTVIRICSRCKKQFGFYHK